METEKEGCGGQGCACSHVTDCTLPNINKPVSQVIDAEDISRMRAFLASQNPRAALRQIRDDVLLIKHLRRMNADETKIATVLNNILELTGWVP